MRNHAPASDTAPLRLAFLLNLCFTVLELAGGFWTDSVVILSNAAHDLGDSVSLALAWYLARFSERGSDRRYSYGYRRFSLMGAVATSAILSFGSVLVLVEAFQRLWRPEQPKAAGMALLAVIGIAANGTALMRVKGRPSLNSRVVGWHLLADVLGWISVLAVSLVLLFRDLPVLDPILSIVISSYVLLNVAKTLRETAQLFLQAVPGGISAEDINRQMLLIDGVKSIHHTHVWSLDGEHNVLTTHLVVARDTSREDLQRIRESVRGVLERYRFEHTTVEIGYEDERCGMNGN